LSTSSVRSILASLFLAAACNNPASAPSAGAPAATTGAAAVTAPKAASGGELVIPALPAIVANVNGQPVTAADLEKLTKSGDLEAVMKLYQGREQALEQLVIEKLIDAEAAKAGKSRDDLLKAEIEGKVTPPTDAEIQSFFDKNVSRMPPGATLDQFRDQIVQRMTKEKQGARMREYIEQLKKGAGVETFLPAFSVDVPARTGAPVKGNASAPVKIIEFSDFQCPYCTRAADTVKEVLTKYGDKVSVEYRHFPLDFHKRAHRAAEGSECANQQGKFWEYHDLLFANQSALEENNLKDYAAKAGLDVAKFDACMADAGTAKIVDADMENGASVGMSGTPGFYINGKLLAGAVPIEEFAKVIDAELKKAGKL
jgi:protein-disulfide isomerase